MIQLIVNTCVVLALLSCCMSFYYQRKINRFLDERIKKLEDRAELNVTRGQLQAAMFTKGMGAGK